MFTGNILTLILKKIYKIWTFVSLKRQQLIQGGLINKNKWLDAENYVTNNE